MKKNISSIERWLRVIVGVILIALALMGTIGNWGYIGVVPLVTGLLSFCPIYRLLGLNRGSEK